jgi:hypothetical protein
MEHSIRISDKTHQPSEEEMRKFIGKPAVDAWIELKHFIYSSYDLKGETLFYGKKYGWTIRYRKSGTTLCTLFPEKSEFTVLIVLGKKDSEKVLSLQQEFSEKTQLLLRKTQQLHDGRWLWLRISQLEDIEDVKKLLHIKRRPKKQ